MMNRNRTVLAALALLSATLLPARAGLAGPPKNKDLDVKAKVDAQCSISTTAVDFGTYDVFAPADSTTSGKVTVSCTKGASVWIDLDDGKNTSGAGVRNMKHATLSDLLNYELYKDASYSARWGAGDPGAGGNGVNPYGGPSPSASSLDVTVYGKLFKGQTTASTGDYADTVVATVNF